MNIARYLMSAMALNLPAAAPSLTVPPRPSLTVPPRLSLTVPPPDPNKRVWKWEEIQRIAMDEIRKNKDKWPWIAGITGTQIHDLSKTIANAIDRIDKTNNARNRKLGIGPQKYVESTLRAFMPAQSRNYASLVMEPLQKNPATKITSDDLIDLAREIHHTPEDFEEGDISDRISNHWIWVLKEIDIKDIPEQPYRIESSRADKIAVEMSSNSNIYPPIIYDTELEDVIDGNHRLAAAKMLGFDHISAYVPNIIQKNPSESSKYKTGLCDAYAIAMHRLFGYPIFAVRGYFKEDGEWNTEDSHLVVKSGAKFIDVDGAKTKKELIDQCHFTVGLGISKVKIEEVSEEEAAYIFTTEGVSEEQISDAENYINRNLKKNGGIFIRSRDGWYSGYPQPQLHVNPGIDYVGNCIDSFDDDGECTNRYLPYSDTSSFAVAEESAIRISKDEFLSKASVPEILSKLVKRNKTEYLLDTKGVYMIHDTNRDIHYFFT